MTALAATDTTQRTGKKVRSLTRLVEADAELLGAQLKELRARAFPPSAEKRLRKFSSVEAASLIGVTDAYIRHLSLAGEAPDGEKTARGRRMFTLEQVHEFRRLLAKTKPNYSPTRRPGDHMQVIAVTNFKGGSGKTTTAAHVAQYFAMRGYRTLAVDLDPQASLSALFGLQPEFDLQENDTLYGAIRYDDKRRTLSEIIRKTYFTGLYIVPGNLELQEFEHDTPKVLSEKRKGSDRLIFFLASRALWRPSIRITTLSCRLPAVPRLSHALGFMRRAQRFGHHSPTDVGRRVDVPVFAHDRQPSRRRRRSRGECRLRFLSLRDHTVRTD